MNYAVFALSALGGGANPAGNICVAANNAVLLNFNIAQSSGAANLTALNFTTSGGYVAGDITDYKLWASSSNVFSTATNIATLPASGAGLHTFTAFTQTLNDASTTYFWITIDLPGSATPGSTININTITALTDLTISSGTRIGTASAGGLQTINPMPLPIYGISFYDCVGSFITLNDTTVPAIGTWSSSNPGVATTGGTGSTALVFGTGVGTTVISYTIGGCSATAVVTVSTGLPALSPSLPTSVCVDSSITFTDAVPSGTWSASGGISVSSTGVVTGTTSGTGAVSYSFGSCTVTAPVTINPLPLPIIGPTNLCAYDQNTITLSDSSAGGIWSADIVTITGYGSNGVVSGWTPGTSGNLVTYTLPTGCATFVNLTVNPLPTPILGVDTICASNTTTLTDLFGDGKWSSSNTSVATIDSIYGAVVGVGTGLTTVTYTDSFTTCYTVRPEYVYSFGPIMGPDSLCVSVPGTLYDTSAYASGGLWTINNIAIATLGSPSGASTIITGISAGLDTVTYTIPSIGCMTWDTVRVFPLPSVITGPNLVPFIRP